MTTSPQPVDRASVVGWVADYERAWRTAGTAGLRNLFSEDVVYRVSPWRQAIHGLAALGRFWDAGRDGPGERFTLSRSVLAVDDRTAVVRVHVDYEAGRSWRDLWVLHFADDGRVDRFEEWPFAADTPDGQDDVLDRPR